MDRPYLSQQVFELSLIAKYSANSLLFWEDNAVNFQMLQKLAALFLGMSVDQCLSNVYFQLLVYFITAGDQASAYQS